MLTAYHPQNEVSSSGSIPSRLAQAGAPKAIVGEVERLASQNGISLNGGKRPDLIDLLFRKSAETEPELVLSSSQRMGKAAACIVMKAMAVRITLMKTAPP